MALGKRLLFASAWLAVLTACSGAPVAPAPATIAPAPAPTLVGGIPTPPEPTAAPTARPSATAAPTAMPTADAPIPAFAPATATPAFPEARVTEANLAALRELRAIGFGQAMAADIAPDGRLLAVGTTAGVALFELPALRHLRFDRVDGGAQIVSFSADGRTLSITTGGVSNPFAEPQGKVLRVADGSPVSTGAPEPAAKPLTVFSPDGAIEARFNMPDSSPTPGVQLHRVADGQLIYQDNLSERVAFSPDGQTIVLVAYDGTLLFLDASGKLQRTLALPVYWSVAFSPDGQSMVTAGRAVWLWDVVTSAPRQKLDELEIAAETAVYGADQVAGFSPDGRVLTVAGEYTVFEAGLRHASAWRVGDGGATHAWDTDARGAGVMNFRTYVGAISMATNAAAWTDDGIALTVTRGEETPLALSVPAGVGALAFSPDGALLAVGDKAGLIRLVRAADGSVAQTIRAGQELTLLNFSPDGSLLGGRVANRNLLIWNVADGGLASTIAVKTPSVDTPPRIPFIFTPDNSMVITSGAEPVRFYRLSDGALVHQLDVRADDVAIGPRQRLLGLVRDGRVELWGVP